VQLNVRFWHKADIPARSTNVRFWGWSGRRQSRVNYYVTDGEVTAASPRFRKKPNPPRSQVIRKPRETSSNETYDDPNDELGDCHNLARLRDNALLRDRF